MPRRGGKHMTMVRGAEDAMYAFRLEIAKDLGLADKLAEDHSFKNFTTVEVGQIGGEMTRRIQMAGEYAVMQRYRAGEKRLMPTDVLPDPTMVSTRTNAGNESVMHNKENLHNTLASQFVDFDPDEPVQNYKGGYGQANLENMQNQQGNQLRH